MSKVSIIIPNYNNSFWLPKCLDSCLQQDVSFLEEIIVVDDHSEDESWNILTGYQQKHPEIIKIYKNPGKGGNLARNYGFSFSTGEFIQWLDSDDMILPGKLKAQVTELISQNKDVAYSDWRIDHYQNGIFQNTEAKLKEAYNDFLFEILKDNWNPPNTYLLRRAIADQLVISQGWNPATRVGQDREYFTKAAISKAKFIYVPGAYAVYNRWSTKTVSHVNFQQRLEICHKMQYDFALLINEAPGFSREDKKRYLAVLNSQAIVGCFYNGNLELKHPFNIFNLNWKIINWKLRFIIPILFLLQKTRFLFKKSWMFLIKIKNIQLINFFISIFLFSSIDVWSF